MSTSEKLKIGICQLAVRNDKSLNMDQADAMISQAVGRGCRLVILPEMFNCPYESELFPEYAETWPDGPTIRRLAAAAAKHQITLVGGSIPEREQEKIFNTSFVFGEQGNLLAHHRKVHLFDVDIKGGTVFQESKTLTAGDQATVVTVGDLTFGVAICYDIRFQAFARTMMLQGAKLLIYPAAFGPVTGPAHWELLMRSRAIDNQVFIVGAAPAKTPGAEYQAYGHSMAVDPWGNILVRAEEDEAVLSCELDFAFLEKVRSELPILQHWRDEIYKK